MLKIILLNLQKKEREKERDYITYDIMTLSRCNVKIFAKSGIFRFICKLNLLQQTRISVNEVTFSQHLFETKQALLCNIK